jgi:hypothetical protein
MQAFSICGEELNKALIYQRIGQSIHFIIEPISKNFEESAAFKSFRSKLSSSQINRILEQ